MVKNANATKTFFENFFLLYDNSFLKIKIKPR